MYLLLQSIGGISLVEKWHGNQFNHYFRVAYRRLLPGSDQGAATDNRTLLQVCFQAIQRFSPSAMQIRRIQCKDGWDIPEATFQDEMYCCLHHELRHLPILSENAHTPDGRIDFFVYDKKWGVEILQTGKKSQVMKHMARFELGGKYRTWNILDDYIVLNFCLKSKLQEFEIEGKVIPITLLDLRVPNTRSTNARQRALVPFLSGCDQSWRTLGRDLHLRYAANGHLHSE